ncbi:DUF2730 family protein [Pararhodospirillum oryzae]|uniref:DUF2730 domain-containing protein n=1 Tax=Pararhodospirillum oryzae TaxID=478448 RepID=A0A512HA10_9PROT|nr:DUF2730 family protein [Pararhodospirillum oryzae]GEO82285.1 hypothetical protein ROR02_24160 [Pararhodospirillum oryzae]
MTAREAWDVVVQTVPVISLGVTALGGAVLWRLSRIFVTREALDRHAEHEAAWRGAHDARVEEVSERLDRGERRFAALEASIGALPSQANMQALESKLSDLRADVARLGGQLDGAQGLTSRLERVVDMLTEHHLQGERRP